MMRRTYKVALHKYDGVSRKTAARRDENTTPVERDRRPKRRCADAYERDSERRLRRQKS